MVWVWLCGLVNSVMILIVIGVLESSRWLSWDGDDFCVNQAYMKAWK
jgi:hypothetical protein